jgi:hypothetical protein
METEFVKLKALYDSKLEALHIAEDTLKLYKKKENSGGIFSLFLEAYWSGRWLKFFPVYDKAFDEFIEVAEALQEAQDVSIKQKRDYLKLLEYSVMAYETVQQFKDKMLI